MYHAFNHTKGDNLINTIEIDKKAARRYLLLKLISNVPFLSRRIDPVFPPTMHQAHQI